MHRKIEIPDEIANEIAGHLLLSDRAHFSAVNRRLYHLFSKDAKCWLQAALDPNLYKFTKYKRILHEEYGAIKDLPLTINTKLEIAKIVYNKLLHEKMTSINGMSSKDLTFYFFMLGTVLNYFPADYFAHRDDQASWCVQDSCEKQQWNNFILPFFIGEFVLLMVCFYPKLLPALLDAAMKKFAIMMSPEISASVKNLSIFSRSIQPSNESLVCELSTVQPESTVSSPK